MDVIPDAEGETPLSISLHQSQRPLRFFRVVHRFGAQICRTSSAANTTIPIKTLTVSIAQTGTSCEVCEN